MAENAPTPPAGGLPPKAGDSAKVQPKKETVRITLPPKPTAAPTIKLPTLPAGGPLTGVTAAPRSAPPPPPPGAGAAAPKAPLPPPPGVTGARVAGAAAAQRPGPPALGGATGMTAKRPAPAVAAISGLDKGLAFTAMIVSVIALASVVLLGWFNEVFYQAPQ